MLQLCFLFLVEVPTHIVNHANSSGTLYKCHGNIVYNVAGIASNSIVSCSTKQSEPL